MFNKNKKITLLDLNWIPITRNLSVIEIPRKGEMIYLNKTKINQQGYFKVINVVHQFEESYNEIYVIVEHEEILKIV